MYRLAVTIATILLIFGARPGFAAVLDGPMRALVQTQTAEPGTEEAPVTQEGEEEEPDCD